MALGEGDGFRLQGFCVVTLLAVVDMTPRRTLLKTIVGGHGCMVIGPGQNEKAKDQINKNKLAMMRCADKASKHLTKPISLWKSLGLCRAGSLWRQGAAFTTPRED